MTLSCKESWSSNRHPTTPRNPGEQLRDGGWDPKTWGRTITCVIIDGMPNSHCIRLRRFHRIKPRNLSLLCQPISFVPSLICPCATVLPFLLILCADLCPGIVISGSLPLWCWYWNLLCSRGRRCPLCGLTTEIWRSGDLLQHAIFDSRPLRSRDLLRLRTRHYTTGAARGCQMSLLKS